MTYSNETQQTCCDWKFPAESLFLGYKWSSQGSWLSLEVVSHSVYMPCKGYVECGSACPLALHFNSLSIEATNEMLLTTSTLSGDFAIGNHYPLLKGHAGQLQTHA